MDRLFNRITGSLIIFVISLSISVTASAQVIWKSDVLQLTAAADTFRKAHPVEKLYLQFDKPYYALGDTIWFKAYLFNAAYLTPSDKSGILYIEMENNNKVIKRMMFPVASGVTWGDIGLATNEFPEGSYTLRAYTNWMRNFGEDYIFKKSFYFGNTNENGWLVAARVSLLKDNGIDKAGVSLQFNQLNKQPVMLKDMLLDIYSADKSWYKRKVQTTMDGSVDINFNLKAPAKQLTIAARETSNGAEVRKLIIPLSLNRPENMDLQFMPEGGNLVAGLPACVGFKAIGEDGRAVAAEGSIYNSRNEPVASFKSVHDGMGMFYMTPQVGETYMAKVALPGGIFKVYNLPTVKNAGTVLKLRENKSADSLIITITATYENSSYYLIGQSRGVVSYGAAVTLVNNAFRVKIPTNFFPTGITRFTLLNAARQPVNERLVFINHHDNLQIAVMPGKPTYAPGDSIAIQLHVTDKVGNPVAGNFSLAVTDDSQIKTDSTGADMISNLLLTSDLKGDVNRPAYYFQPDASGNVKQQLDNLLLTQGWVGYDWRDVLNSPRKNLYRPEHDFQISGRVVNVFNKPLANTSVIIFSKKPALVIETVTGKDGRFVFKGIMPLDTPVFIVQARNRQGKSFNVSVAVDEFDAPLFIAKPQNVVPWYVNSDTTLINFMKTNVTAKRQQEKVTGGGHVLKEVVISAKKFIRNSQNLNGSGNADQVIDEQELEKAGKKTFLDLLNEKVKGFKEGFFLLSGPTKKAADDQKFARFIFDIPDDLEVSGISQDWYFINGRPVKFIIDGSPLYKVISSNSSGGSPYIRNVIDYLKSHSAEDIKGIEVNSSSKYASLYVPIKYATDINAADIAFIEITTRSGGGPGISNTPGTYLYKPLPFSVPKQFYRPRYAVQNKDTTVADYKSTIYWAPNVVTDKNGKATVSFYGAGRIGTYTVIVEGTDWNGALGSTRAAITLTGK